METNIINKDKVWNRINNYIYIVVFLVSFLIILLLVLLLLNCLIYNQLLKQVNVPLYTST